MNRRKFLKSIGMSVAVAPIAATTIQEAVRLQEEMHESKRKNLTMKDFYGKVKMNIDSNYPEFYMSWDDPKRNLHS